MRIYKTTFKTIRDIKNIVLAVDFNSVVSVEPISLEYAMHEYYRICVNDDVSYSERMLNNGCFTIGEGVYIIDIDHHEEMSTKYRGYKKFLFKEIYDYIMPSIREYNIKRLLDE